jgi:hypothetical protein
MSASGRWANLAADLLGTSQIDEVKVPAFLTSILGIPLMDPNDEDGM